MCVVGGGGSYETRQLVPFNKQLLFDVRNYYCEGYLIQTKVITTAICSNRNMAALPLQLASSLIIFSVFILRNQDLIFKFLNMAAIFLYVQAQNANT